MIKINQKTYFISFFIILFLIIAFTFPVLFSKNDYTDVFFAMDTFFEISIPRETSNKEEIIEEIKNIVFFC